MAGALTPAIDAKLSLWIVFKMTTDHLDAWGDALADSLRVSVVCPFFNEQAVIAETAVAMAARIAAAFGDGAELILVNDGSTDDSLQIALDSLKAANAQNVRVFSYPNNQGRGRALKTGIDAARGEVIVTTEADGSWGYDIVERLVERLETKPDVDFVIASPHRAGGGLINVPEHRVYLSRFGNLLIRGFFESGVTMNTGMTRAYRRAVIQPLIVLENGKEFHLEVLLKLLTLGFRFSEVPAKLTWPEEKATQKPTAKRKSSTKILKTVASHLKFALIAQPVRYFAITAATTVVAGAIFMLLAIINLFDPSAPSVFYALIAMILFLFSLTLAGVSVILLQIREVMKNNWMQGYGPLLPPSARGGAEVFNGSTKADS